MATSEVTHRTIKMSTTIMLARQPIRVLLVDDHMMVHIGITGMLEAFADLELVGIAACGQDAPALCSRLKPDVILMDLVMPGMDGITAIRQILQQLPQVAIIALTNYDDGARVNQALQAGASGYLLKNVTAHELAASIRATFCGRVTLAPEAAHALLYKERQPLLSPLTSRECETLQLLVKGFSNSQIAKQLSVSQYTAKNHVHNILQKLNVANRAEAAIFAIRHGIVAVE